MKARQPRPLQIVASAAVAIACALLVVVMLVTITKPPRFDDRLARVQGESNRTEALLRPRGDGPAFPQNAVCRSAPQREAQKLEGELAGLAAAFRLDHASVEVSPPTSSSASADLVPLQVHFEGSGPYEGAMAALQRLGQLRPLLFVDTVDLSSRTSFVTLVVSGHVYCSAPH